MCKVFITAIVVETNSGEPPMTKYTYVALRTETVEKLKKLKKFPTQPYWHVIELLIEAVSECKEKCRDCIKCHEV